MQQLSEMGVVVSREGPERLLLFSDAVVAIAITLLAIELPVPAGHSAHEFWTSVHHNDRHYLAFVASFFVIAAAWSQHRRVWALADRYDQSQQNINMVWLFTIVLIPFATSLLHVEGQQTVTAHALRFGFYALLEVIDDAMILLVARRMLTQHYYRADVEPDVVRASYWPCYGVMVGFGLSIPVFFATTYGWVLWIVGPMVVNRIGRVRGRSAAPNR